MDWFWENSVDLSVAGQPLRVLTPEANVIHLSAHLAAPLLVSTAWPAAWGG